MTVLRKLLQNENDSLSMYFFSPVICKFPVKMIIFERGFLNSKIFLWTLRRQFRKPCQRRFAQSPKYFCSKPEQKIRTFLISSRKTLWTSRNNFWKQQFLSEISLTRQKWAFRAPWSAYFFQPFHFWAGLIHRWPNISKTLLHCLLPYPATRWWILTSCKRSWIGVNQHCLVLKRLWFIEKQHSSSGVILWEFQSVKGPCSIWWWHFIPSDPLSGSHF